MKYIRTEDEKIFLIHEDLDNKDLWYFESKEKTIVISCNPIDLGKVADTIEELCDEFVLYDSKDMINTFISTYERVMNWKEVLDKRKLDKPNYEIYGAIWTDKGLIYVAKMNDKGELELL